MKALIFIFCLTTGISDLASLKFLPSAQAAEVLKIVDNQEVPIANAEVTLGPSEGDPFLNNILRTNEGGEVEKPMEWNTELPVTIHSTNHVLTTYMDTTPSRQVLHVNHRDTENFIPIEGEVSGYGRIRDGDKKVDFSLVLPALTRRQLLNFDIYHILSPEKDILKIRNYEFGLPSNISIPSQRESYIIFPIKFNKPTYRVLIREYGQKRLVAIRGRFSLKQVINDFRAGRSILGLVNHFQFLSGSELGLSVQGPVKGRDIRVDGWKLDDKFHVQAPQYGRDRIMLSLSLMENVYGEMFPMDIKMIESNEVKTLKSRRSGNNQYALSVLVNKTSSRGGLRSRGNLRNFKSKKKLNFHQVSLVINRASERVTPVFLSMIDSPKVSGSTLVLNPPKAMTGVFPVATYLALSRMEPLPNSAIHASKKTRLWEIFNNSWISQIELPDVPLNLDSGNKYVWEVIYLGSEREMANGEDWTLEDVSHVTRHISEI